MFFGFFFCLLGSMSSMISRQLSAVTMQMTNGKCVTVFSLSLQQYYQKKIQLLTYFEKEMLPTGQVGRE